MSQPVSSVQGASANLAGNQTLVLPKQPYTFVLVSIVFQLANGSASGICPVLEWLDGESQPFARVVGTLVSPPDTADYAFALGTQWKDQSSVLIAGGRRVGPLPDVEIDPVTTVRLSIDSGTASDIVSSIRWRMKKIRDG